jgi:protein-disulfide isomerase
MKKDISVIIGTVALLVAVFVAAMMFYNNEQNSDKDVENKFARADDALLVREWSPELGPTMARIVLVEFMDPECESCRAVHPIVKKILADYENKIRFVVRYMPFHHNSELAAKWLEASREQNKYWEALDALFETQPQWGAHHNPQPELIPSILEKAGVDIVAAKAALENPEFVRRIRQDKEDGMKLGVDGTPTFFVNGLKLYQLGEDSLRRLIDQELNR